MVTAIELKEQGNKAFGANQYTKAAKLYRDAIKLDPTNPVLYSNRAQCFINLGDYDRGLKDCNCGINLTNDPKLLIKLYYRKGNILKHLGEVSKAEFCFNKVLLLDSGNALAMKELQELKQQPKQESITEVSNKKEQKEPASRNIVIQKVDELPEEYSRLLGSKPTPQIVPSKEVSQEAQKEINQLFNQTSSAESTNTTTNTSKPSIETTKSEPVLPLAALLGLKSLPTAKKLPGYRFVLNMTPEDCQLFDSGVDVEFLDFLFEAGAYNINNPIVDDWEAKLLSIVTTLSSFKRYSLSLLMCNTSNISSILQHIKQNFPESVFSSYEKVLQG